VNSDDFVDGIDEFEQRLAAARREHDEAATVWREIEARRAALQGRRLNKSGRRVVVIDDVEHEYESIDRVEMTALWAQVERDALDHAEVLLEARRKLQHAQMELANAKLPDVISRWRVTEAAVNGAREVTEAALAALLVAVKQMSVARAAERIAARAVNTTAASAGEKIAERLRESGSQLHQVVTMVDREGAAATADRPDLGLFGDEEPPDFEQVGRLIRFVYEEPERAVRQMRGTSLGKVAGF
jgi:hypothetical protein